MDWDRLRIFHVVADAGSFSHASEEINTSQSAISRQISNLEYEVGIPLFHRHPRGLILTEQGELLYKRTRNVVDIIKDAEFELIDTGILDVSPVTFANIGAEPANIQPEASSSNPAAEPNL